MTTLITNIRQLINTREESKLLRGKELAVLPSIQNAFLLVEDGVIVKYGRMEDLPSIVPQLPSNVIDSTGQFVLPCWCDSHTHLVYHGSREEEFVDRIRGMSYSEIAAKGGGILNSAKRVNEATEDELFAQSWKRLEEIASLGTGAVEIKSGYGLNADAEIKMLRVIKKLKDHSKISIRSTFLAAHAFPPEYKDNHKGYIDIIINEMLPVVANEKLADYIDVFCEEGFFSPAETEMIGNAGLKYELKPRLHVNQLNSIGGIETGIKLNATSLDHLESLTGYEIKLLSGYPGVCTLLPTAAFFLRSAFPPARQLIDEGCAIAIASDFNPGSSPGGNMNMVIAMSCIQMKMLPEEAINAATVNGAFAMELHNDVGSITAGKKANLIFTKPIPSVAYLPYAFGSNLIEKVMLSGDIL